MSSVSRARHAGSITSALTIGPPTRRQLVDASHLLAAGLGFAPADAVPAWFMRTSDDCGGITLVAIADRAVVGAVHAIAGFEDREPFLFVCGLVVADSHRGCQLGLALMDELHRLAALGSFRTIRWTADPTNGRALRLYLRGLRARAVAYRPGLHDGLRDSPGHPLDDLELIWNMHGDAGATDGARVDVELPWSDPTPADRARVREAMTRLLSTGYVGTDVAIDRRAQRCRVAFERPCRHPTS